MLFIFSKCILSLADAVANAIYGTFMHRIDANATPWLHALRRIALSSTMYRNAAAAGERRNSVDTLRLICLPLFKRTNRMDVCKEEHCCSTFSMVHGVRKGRKRVRASWNTSNTSCEQVRPWGRGKETRKKYIHIAYSSEWNYARSSVPPKSLLHFSQAFI